MQNIFILIDNEGVIVSYALPLHPTHVPFKEGIEITTDKDLDTLCFNYRYSQGNLEPIVNKEVK